MQYANKNAARIAARAAADFDYSTLDVTININPDAIPNAVKINLAIESGKSFILYRDADTYAVIVPGMMAIECHSLAINTNEVCSTPKQFQNRVKIAAVTYPNYFEIDNNAQPTKMLQLREEDSRGSLDSIGHR